jgi:hypothetical protein
MDLSLLPSHRPALPQPTWTRREPLRKAVGYIVRDLAVSKARN